MLRFFGIPPLIPDLPFTRIDLGSIYVDPAGDGFKQTLITILNALDLFLPDPPI
ncbi:MAG: hypothetical protein M5R36_22255 [Deltaproteobacteria bacterium]|nr:hypothetical protein [Deltaproteobacteria bacterium]